MRGTGGFPSQKASNTESVCRWWRHHDLNKHGRLWKTAICKLIFVTVKEYMCVDWIPSLTGRVLTTLAPYFSFRISFLFKWCLSSIPESPWWRHQMATFSALLALCAGNSPVTGEFPAQRPVTRIFDVFFELCLNKRLSKQSCGWWFETPSRSLWRHCDAKPVDALSACGHELHWQSLTCFCLHSELLSIIHTIWLSRKWKT